MSKSFKYSENFKENAVRVYLQGNDSATSVAKNLGIGRHTLYNWIKKYNNGIVVQERSMDVFTQLETSSSNDDVLNIINNIEDLIKELKKHLLESGNNVV